MPISFHIHGHGQFDAKHRIGPCVWAHFDLLTIHSGRIWIELMHHDRIELRGKQSILIYPHTYFAGASISKQSGASVQHFGLGESERTFGTSHPLGRLVGRSGGYELYPISKSSSLSLDIRRAVSLAHSPASPFAQSMREAILTLILGQLLLEHSEVSHGADPLKRAGEFASVMQWATANFQKQITLNEMAREAGYSTSHFRAQFLKQVGYSAGAFLRQSRYLEAARLLRETQIPIKEIAQRVGYDDLAHFYRFFTKTSRSTPQKYRLRHQLRG
jgi:AraC-like DNA-binding protein